MHGKLMSNEMVDVSVAVRNAVRVRASGLRHGCRGSWYSYL